MACSVVGKFTPSFPHESSAGTDDRHFQSISSLAVSSLASVSKSRSEASCISISAASEQQEMKTNSTTSSPISGYARSKESQSKISQEDPPSKGTTASLDLHRGQIRSHKPTNSECPDPPAIVLVYPKAKPYAQLCFNQVLNTLTVLLVGPESTPFPLASRTDPGLLKHGFTYPHNTAQSSSCSSSSDGDESGWSTGDEMSTSSSHSGSERLSEMILWMDEHWYHESRLDNGADAFEQHQSLLRPDEHYARLATVSTIDQTTFCCRWCLCLVFCRPTAKRVEDIEGDHHVRSYPLNNEKQQHPISLANWFRYVALTD